jgi:DNA-directed RNA polymerase sigma subunit (sigma70/sigma32)
MPIIKSAISQVGTDAKTRRQIIMGNRWHKSTGKHQGGQTPERQSYKSQAHELPSDRDTQQFLFELTGLRRSDVLEMRRLAGDNSTITLKEVNNEPCPILA